MASTGFDRWVASLREREARRHLRPGARVCDLGCGPEAWLLGTLGDAGRRVGFDHQPVRARPPGVAFVRGDVTRALPFRDASFDHVTMLAVLEHLKAPERALGEAFRILAPGGSLILTWPAGIVDPLLHVLHAIGVVGADMESGDHQPRRPWTAWRDVLLGIGFAEVLHRRFELGVNHLAVARKPARGGELGPAIGTHPPAAGGR
jgi:SAM-dependent methyltransferase